MSDLSGWDREEKEKPRKVEDFVRNIVNDFAPKPRLPGQRLKLGAPPDDVFESELGDTPGIRNYKREQLKKRWEWIVGLFVLFSIVLLPFVVFGLVLLAPILFKAFAISTIAFSGPALALMVMGLIGATVLGGIFYAAFKVAETFSLGGKIDFKVSRREAILGVLTPAEKNANGEIIQPTEREISTLKSTKQGELEMGELKEPPFPSENFNKSSLSSSSTREFKDTKTEKFEPIVQLKKEVAELKQSGNSLYQLPSATLEPVANSIQELKKNGSNLSTHMNSLVAFQTVLHQKDIIEAVRAILRSLLERVVADTLGKAKAEDLLAPENIKNFAALLKGNPDVLARLDSDKIQTLVHAFKKANGDQTDSISKQGSFAKDPETEAAANAVHGALQKVLINNNLQKLGLT